jgi:T-complex protein 1 subunit delta
MIAGGGAPEIETSMKLAKYSQSLEGLDSYCIKEYANALEIIPYTLAENAGLNPMEIVTELKARHAAGCATAGINVRKGCITDILEENVIQPLLVTTSSLNLATECVRMLLKIDDIVAIR